jgi:sucrose-6-phosphate hydrolase SacC (GH32 family)
MRDWNLPGWDYNNVSNITQWLQCQMACDNEVKCLAWTFVKDRQINANCFLKSGVPFGISASNHVSDVKPRQNNEQILWIYINRTLSQRNPDSAHGLYHAPLWLQSTTTSNQWFLQLDIFIDHSVIEVFEPEGGRFVITARVYPEDVNANNFAVYVRDSPGNIILNTIDAWNLTTIWTWT